MEVMGRLPPSPLKGETETVRLKIPQLRINVGGGGEDGLLKRKLGRNYLTNCVVCDTKYETDGSFSMPLGSPGNNGVGGMIYFNQEEWARRVQVVRALCIYLNVPEYLDSLDALRDNLYIETETTVLIKAFHLCPQCNENGSKLALLQQQLETLLVDIKSLSQVFQTAIITSATQKQSGQGELEAGNNNENYSVSQFRNLVLRSATAGFNNMEAGEYHVPDETAGQEYFEPETDFAYLETVSSTCPSEGGFNLEDDFDAETEIKCEIRSPSSCSSNSPAFSPISFYHDTELGPTENITTQYNNENEVNQVDVQESTGDILSEVQEPVPEPKTKRLLKQKHPKVLKGRRKKLTRKRSKKKLSKSRRKKPKKVVPTPVIIEKKLTIPTIKLPPDLPECDMEGYITMHEMHIPFQRVEVPLKRLRYVLAGDGRVEYSDSSDSDSSLFCVIIPDKLTCKKSRNAEKEIDSESNGTSNDPNHFSSTCQNLIEDDEQSSRKRMKLSEEANSSKVIIDDPKNNTKIVCPTPGDLVSHTNEHNMDLESSSTSENPTLEEENGLNTGLLANGTDEILGQGEPCVIDHDKVPEEDKDINTTASFTENIIVRHDEKILYKGSEISKTETGKYECLTCMQSFDRLIGVKCHIRKIHNNPLFKNIRNQNLPTKKNLPKIPGSDETNEPIPKTTDSVIFGAEVKERKVTKSKASGKFHHFKKIQKTIKLKHKIKKSITTKVTKWNKRRFLLPVVKKTPFACNVPGCEESFSSLDLVKVHVKTHDVKKKSYDCLECTESFTTKKDLNIHMTSEHSNDSDSLSDLFTVISVRVENGQEPPLLFPHYSMDSETSDTHSIDSNNNPPRLLPFYQC